MLINKFRLKYNNAKSPASSIDDCDYIIREEIENMMQTTTLNEADLTNVDARIRARLGMTSNGEV